MDKIDRLKRLLKQIFHMVVLQWQGIAGNLAAIIIIIGLAVLPSFYAWFNIAANEDPYGNTSNLKVAVCNKDKGSQVDVFNVNVGDKIIDKLKGNDAIGWTILDDAEEAIDGVKNGDFYAAIIIPETFSKDISSVFKGTIIKPQMDYYVNEKINAITPKVTDKGISTLENEVNSAFIKTVTEVALSSLKVLDDRYQKYRPTVDRIADDMEMVNENLGLFWQNLDAFYHLIGDLNLAIDNGRATLPEVTKTLNNASELTLVSQDALLKSKESILTIRQIVIREMNSIPVLMSDIRRSMDDVFRLKDKDVNLAVDRLDYPKERFQELGRKVERVRDLLDSINNSLPRPLNGLTRGSNDLLHFRDSVNNMVDLIVWSQDTLESSSRSIDEVRDTVNKSMDNIEMSVKQTIDVFNGPVEDAMNEFTDQTLKTLDSTYSLLQQSSNVIPKINQLLISSQNATKVSLSAIDGTKKSIDRSREILTDMTEGIRKLHGDEKIDEMLKLIRQDVDKESEFFANPVEISRHRFFPVPNYGTAMSPFYTILAIWVGALLMMSMISPINKKGLAVYPNTSTFAMYVSRLSFYQTIAIVQSLIITLGDLLLLDVYCVHPVGLVFFNLFVAFVFATFVFSILFVFRNVGKALCIVALVLQIAASGGTFPVEMMPGFFQAIHPILPFTYAIGGMRELIAGMDGSSTLWHDIEVLFSIAVLSFIFVLVVGPRVIRLVERFEKQMKKSGIE